MDLFLCVLISFDIMPGHSQKRKITVLQTPRKVVCHTENAVNLVVALFC